MRPRLVYPIALLSGAALSLAFPRPSLSFVAWVALAPPLALTSGAGARRGALAWALFGFGFFATLLSWISIVGWAAWGGALVIEVPFIAAFGAVWGALSGRTSALGRIASAAGAWAAIEFLRSLWPMGGFTWGQLAQSQHDVFWMLEWAALGGGVVLGGVLAGVNAALAELVRARKDGTRSLAVPGAWIVAAFAIPIVLSLFHVESDATPLRVGLVQGNADPDIPAGFDKDVRILRSHVHLTEELHDPVDVVVWPESAVALDPDYPGVDDSLERAASAVDAPMIVGGNEDVDEERYRVSAFFVDRSGTIVDRYRKTHLVPFGEYVPLRGLVGRLSILDQVPRDAVAGDEGKLFSVKGVDIATVISFEGDFGSLVRGRIASGGDILVVATNTSTWLNTWASEQHVAFSQVRAAENATPVVHAAISGISAFISERGEILESLPLYRPGSLVRAVTPRATTTPYTRFGDWTLVVAILVCAGLWGLGHRRHKRAATWPAVAHEGVASPDA